MARNPTIETFESALEGWQVRLRRLERLRRVEALLVERWPAIVSREEAAREAAMTETAFSEYFRQKVGIPFGRCQRALRVGRAIVLLRDTEHSILRIAGMAGFSSLQAMERAFRAFVGMTPRAYRRGVLERGDDVTRSGP